MVVDDAIVVLENITRQLTRVAVRAKPLSMEPMRFGFGNSNYISHSSCIHASDYANRDGGYFVYKNWAGCYLGGC